MESWANIRSRVVVDGGKGRRSRNFACLSFRVTPLGWSRDVHFSRPNLLRWSPHGLYGHEYRILFNRLIGQIMISLDKSWPIPLSVYDLLVFFAFKFNDWSSWSLWSYKLFECLWQSQTPTFNMLWDCFIYQFHRSDDRGLLKEYIWLQHGRLHSFNTLNF